MTGRAADDMRQNGTEDQAGVKRSMGEQTWTVAVREVWRSALRHKVISAIVVLCVAGSLTAIGLVGSASGSASDDASGDAVQPDDVPAPGFSLPVLGHAGQRVSLSDYAGKPLILNFFASWCPPCKRETPMLARFYRSEHGKVALVGLDENDVQANAVSFTHADRVSYPVGFDPSFTLATPYNVGALPQTFFLDARHRIVYRVFGAVTAAELSKGIALAAKGS